ncbi:MAG: glycosyltransferase [Muribaculaceae bacterium]|nr:glycosyltransferase [Muribaculaceae bacterium]
MKISIIIPVYNAEKFLRRCLDSLINQTLKDIEIICVNDSSTDNSLAILNEYAQIDNRIVVISQENSGPSEARNRGLDIAKGEYIGFVDSDDWVSLDYFENLYNAAKENNADIAAAGIIKLDERRKREFLTFKTKTITADFKENCLALDIPSKTYVWNKIYLREKLDKYNLRFKAGVYYEDMIFTTRVLEKLEKIVTVPDIRYYYWKNKNSIVFQKTKKHKEDYKAALKFTKELFKKHNIDIGEEKIQVFGVTIFKKIKKIDETIFIIFNFIKFKK